MKDFFVIIASPDIEKSISAKVGLTSLKQIHQQGKSFDIKIINLYQYKIPFYYKIPSTNNFSKIPKDLKRIIKEMSYYKVFIFIFPIWWSNMPAILKNFFDWSIYFGVKYDFKSSKKPLYKGKKAFLITACGASDYSQKEKEQMFDLIRSNILAWWGIKTTDSVFIEGANHISERKLKKHIEESTKKLLKLIN